MTSESSATGWRTVACMSGMHDLCGSLLMCQCRECDHEIEWLQRFAQLQKEQAQKALHALVVKKRVELGLPPDYFVSA